MDHAGRGYTGTMIEIEKKFLLTDAQQRRLLTGATPLGAKTIEDSYFDTDDYRLTSRDNWLRRRDGAFELKAPLVVHGKAHAVNRYRELTNPKEIASELDCSLNEDEGESLAAALQKETIIPFMTCYTNRKSYEKAGFRIDVDEVTYKGASLTYRLAEIELLVNSEDDADAAEQKIIAFAKEMDLATDRIIEGKVLVYMKAKCPARYRASIFNEV